MPVESSDPQAEVGGTQPPGQFRAECGLISETDNQTDRKMKRLGVKDDEFCRINDIKSQASNLTSGSAKLKVVAGSALMCV